MRIGIDAMGGDNGVQAAVKGALAAKAHLGDDDRAVLVGDEAAIRRELGDGSDSGHIEIAHASQQIGMNEPPVEALRAKPDSSIAVMAQMHAEGRLDACISAGSTGAFVAAAQMRLRRLPGVHRPGIMVITPTHHGPVAVCDVGANVNCRPQHLQQYGRMMSVYLKHVYGIDVPRVGLMSIGEEDAKGNTLVKEARELLRADGSQNFIGNVEGRDLFRGVCDAVVCEGFVGNVVLKMIEGMAESVLRGMVVELTQSLPEHAKRVVKAGEALADKYDFNSYGGAPLLGVAGVCIICHGATDWRGIMNAVKGAHDLVEHHINQEIVGLLAEGERAVNA